MKQELKYVNFYKSALLHGTYKGLNCDDNLSLYLDSDVIEASYITPMFDTNEITCTYNRLIIDGGFSGIKLEVIVAATDQRVFYIDDEATDIATYLASKEVALTE